MTTLDAQATTAPEVVADPVEELAGRLFMEGLGALHLGTVYLGVKLGLFEELAARDTMTSSELAAARGLDAAGTSASGCRRRPQPGWCSPTTTT